MNPASMARVPDLERFQAAHALKMCSVRDIIEWRRRRERLIHRDTTVQVPTPWGAFQLHAYVSATDPEPHLALTMVHEVMVLDHGGPAFGFILYGATLKLLLLSALVARVLLPIVTGNAWPDRLVFVGALFVVAIAIGVVESMMARLRLLHVPRLLVTASILSVFGIVLAG